MNYKSPAWRTNCHKRSESMKIKKRKNNNIYNISVKRSTTGWKTNKKSKGRRDFWVSISPGYVYLSHDCGRAYWVLCNIHPKDRPIIRAADRTQTVWINTYGIKFNKKRDYEYTKKCLLPFSRK